MTIKGLYALVASIDVSTHTPPIRLLVREEGRRVGIQAALDGVNSTTDGREGLLATEPLWLTQDGGLSWANRRNVLKLIWRCILLPLVTHELAEHFLVGGKRYVNPHRN